MFSLYRGLPFAFELRTMLDWTFTETSLSLFQWLKFEDIYAELFITKVTQMVYQRHPLGKKIGRCDKIFQGICGILMIILIILLPLIIFSSLNPTQEKNDINTMSVEIGISVDDHSYYSLYAASRVQQIYRIG